LVKPYIIKERAGVRVGILGVCPQPEGLVTGKNYEGMRYTKPAEAAQPVIDFLRNEEHCDVVVCLSHLGSGNNPDMDPDFITNTTGLDIVLGGHSHTYFNEPQYLLDKKGHEVLIDHQGKNARFLGTIEVMTGFQKE
jgi:5'-nucleotidase